MGLPASLKPALSLAILGSKSLVGSARLAIITSIGTPWMSTSYPRICSSPSIASSPFRDDCVDPSPVKLPDTDSSIRRPAFIKSTGLTDVLVSEPGALIFTVRNFWMLPAALFIDLRKNSDMESSSSTPFPSRILIFCVSGVVSMSMRYEPSLLTATCTTSSVLAFCSATAVLSMLLDMRL